MHVNEGSIQYEEPASESYLLEVYLHQFTASLLRAGWHSVADATREQKDVTTDDQSQPSKLPGF